MSIPVHDEDIYARVRGVAVRLYWFVSAVFPKPQPPEKEQYEIRSAGMNKILKMHSKLETTYFLFGVQQSGCERVGNEPFLAFHDNIAWWVVVHTGVGRPHGSYCTRL